VLMFCKALHASLRAQLRPGVNLVEWDALQNAEEEDKKRKKDKKKEKEEKKEDRKK